MNKKLKHFWKEWGISWEELGMFAGAASIFGFVYAATILLNAFA